MKRILIVLLLVVVGAGYYGYTLYNKPHKDLAGAKADLTLDANTLAKAYSADEAAADAKFSNKVIRLSGTVAEVLKNEAGEVSVNLQTEETGSFVTCVLDGINHKPKVTDFKVGQTVSFKGTCSGKLMDVLVNQCVALK